MSDFQAALRSEWTKIRTVRSTYVTLIVSFVVTVGLGAVVTAVNNSQWHSMSASDQASFDPTSTSFAGVSLGQLALIVFGVLVVSNEYNTGMIRVSLAAVPRRSVLLLAKAAVVTLLVVPVALLTAFVSFFLGQALLGSHHTTIGAHGVLRAVLGAALYLVLLTLLSLGVSFMLRKPVGSLGLLMPFFFLISPILSAVPKVKKVAHYFPDEAGRQLATVHQSGSVPYGPGAAAVIAVLWAAACLLGGYALLRRRDA